MNTCMKQVVGAPQNFILLSFAVAASHDNLFHNTEYSHQELNISNIA
jgi:hypothetical protein